MGYFSGQRGATREQRFTPLEEATRIAREENAEKSPEDIAKAKARNARKAQKKADALALRQEFTPVTVVSAGPDKPVYEHMELEKSTTNDLGRPEKLWLADISDQTDTTITRLDNINLVFRGIPKNIERAQLRIRDELHLTATPSPHAPQ